MFYNDAKPDSIFYQGCSLLKRNQMQEAKALFERLYQYGKDHYHDEVKIDYFAVSLPNFLIFEENLQLRNKVHCDYLMGLGLIGINQFEEANQHLKQALQKDNNHQGIRAINDFIAL